MKRAKVADREDIFKDVEYQHVNAVISPKLGPPCRVPHSRARAIKRDSGSDVERNEPESLINAMSSRAHVTHVPSIPHLATKKTIEFTNAPLIDKRKL